MTIELYYVIFLTSLLVYTLACRHGYMKMKIFLSNIQKIESDSDIEDLKIILKGQMSLAAITLPSGGLAVLLHLYYGFTDLLSFRDIIIFIMFIAANFYYMSVVKGAEKLIATLPACNDNLEKERDRIVYIWQKKMLPKFD